MASAFCVILAFILSFSIMRQSSFLFILFLFVVELRYFILWKNQLNFRNKCQNFIMWVENCVGEWYIYSVNS